MKSLLVGLAAIGTVAYLWSRRSPSHEMGSPQEPAHDRRAHSNVHEHEHEHSYAQGSSTVRTDLDEQIDEKLSRDPIAQAIPMLYDLPKPKQLETLYWMKYAPRSKLLSLLPRLAGEVDLPQHEREQLAADMVDGFIADLEREGVKARGF